MSRRTFGRTGAADAFGDESSAVVFLVSLAASAASVVFALTASGAWQNATARPAMFVSFVVLSLALQLVAVEVYGHGTFSFAGAGFLAVGFTFGIGAAMAVAVLAATLNFVYRRGKLHRGLFTAATWALGAAVAPLPYALLGSADWPEWARFGPALVAGPIYLLVNVGLLSLAMAVAEGSTVRSVWEERFRWMTPYYVASGPIGLALVIAYEKIGLAGVFAFALPPAFMMISAQQYLKKTREAVEETRQTNRELQRANEELAVRNADLHELFQFAAGLAARAHDRASLVAYAETTLSRIMGGSARIRVGRGSGATPLVSGGGQVGTLSLIDDGRLDRNRWERLREVLLPQLATAIESTELVEKVRRVHLDTIAALSRSMEAKDFYTGGHTERVAAISVALAKRLGYSGADLEAIEVGALLHDVGKIGVPERILHKAGPLDEEEWDVIRQHPIISDYILSGIDLPDIVRQIARFSHERLDGHGYPDGLAGSEIPLPARIVLVADAFDSLTTDRPYRPSRPVPAALEEVRADTGTQFCPTVVAALERLAQEEPELLGADRLTAVA